ncbi:MAG: hypothetical protein LBD70_05635 [Bifidobacteriaceae bacterium]|jgi:hypothetical protein|nr:hypothetical protein [Bifidobacteriaceae bacterium]
MNKSSLDSLAAALADQQAATAKAVARLRAELSPESLAALAKSKAADAAKAAALEPSGRPKTWVFVVVAAVVGLTAVAVAVRVARRGR